MKKEILIPVMVLGLIIAFAAVSLLVFLNGGRSERLIRAKLKVITLLLAFNSMIWGVKAQGHEEPLSPLYGPPPDILMIGADVSLNYSSGKDLVLPILNKEPISEFNVHGLSVGFSGFFQYTVPDYRGMKHSLIVGIGYNSCKMTSEEPAFYTVNYIEPFFDELMKPYKVDATVEHEFSTLTLKALYNFRFWGDLSVSLGPDCIFVLENTLTEKLSFDKSLIGKVKFRESLNPKKLESANIAILSQGEPEKNNTILFGGTLDFRYYFEIDRSLGIIPFLGIDFFITSITEDSDWGVMYTNLGIILSYRIE